MDNEAQYVETFGKKLQEELTQMCKEKGLIGERLPETPDIEVAWHRVAEAYIPDALREVTDYPLVALGWAMYAGMGVAVLWDEDWQKYEAKPNIYTYIRDKRGFDYMDEYVRQQMLKLKDKDFDAMERTVQSFAQNVQSRLQHEGTDPQSPTAFKLFVISARCLYRTGAGIALKMLKYDMQAMG